jgi:hypothetical protein
LAAGLAWPRAVSAGSTAALLQVIPQPREVHATGAEFAPSTARFIVVSDGDADRFAARLLQETVRETHGIDCDIVLLPQKSTNWHQLWLSATADVPAAPPTPPAGEKEGYALSVNSAGALIAAESDAGLFYGAQTLMQLLEQSHRDKAAVPGIAVTDWPAFGWRARYFDASQYFGSVVATRENLEREIKLLARYKLNWLCFDAYNFVPFQSFPACADANTLPLSDWNYLVELAHRYHVTLVPSLQSFAQMYDVIWKCDEGKPYREETAPGLICPSRPENIKFLQGLYRDLISIFKYSPVLGIGCSETGMQWDKKYCPRCRERIEKGETLQDIYYKHVRDCVQAVDAAAKEAGRSVRPMMWADEFYMGYDGKRWVGIENIPTNTVMGHWKYWKDYEGISGLLERGFDVFFLSASYQHNIYLVDLSPQDPVDGKWEALLDSGIRNIAGQAQRAAADNLKGLRGKVLGGGCATFSQHDIRSWDTTWFAYVLQAEYSWGDPQRPLDDELNRFTDNFAAIFYDARDRETAQVIASAYRELDAVKSDLERNNYLIRDFIGVYDVQDKSYNGNDLEASLKLIDELAAHPEGPGKTIADIRQRCNHALIVAAAFRQKLAGVAARAGNAASLHYLVSAPHKMENHARRTLLLLDMADAFQKMNSANDAGVQQSLSQTFSQLQERCQELQNDTRVIADEMDDLTQGADPTGYHKALASLEAFAKRLKKAKDALQNDSQK